MKRIMKIIIFIVLSFFITVNSQVLTDQELQKKADLESLKTIKASGLSGATGGDYLTCPDFSTKYFMFFDLYGRFKSAKTAVYVEFWNDDILMELANQSYIANDWVTGYNTKLSILTVTINDPLRFIWNINIGNLWLDYSRYSIAGKWQLKGISIQGDFDDFTRFEIFAVPLENDGFISGAHFPLTFPILDKIGVWCDVNVVNTVNQEKLTDTYLSANNFKKNDNDLVLDTLIHKDLHILGDDGILFEGASENKTIAIRTNMQKTFHEYAMRGEFSISKENFIDVNLAGHYNSKNFFPPFKSIWRNYKLQRTVNGNELGGVGTVDIYFPWFDISGLADITKNLQLTTRDDVYYTELHYNLFGLNLYPHYEYRIKEELNGYSKVENIGQLDGSIQLLSNVELSMRLKYDIIKENKISYDNFEKWIFLNVSLGHRSDLYFEAKVSSLNKKENQDEYDSYWSQYDEFYWHSDNYLRVRLRLRW